MTLSILKCCLFTYIFIIKKKTRILLLYISCGETPAIYLFIKHDYNNIFNINNNFRYIFKIQILSKLQSTCLLL